MIRKISLFLALPLAFLATACLPDINITDLQTSGSIESQDDKKIEVLFSSDAGTATVELESSYPWTVKSINDRADEWISWTPDKGKRGTTTVEITVPENNTYDERSATLVFKSVWKEQTIVVTQKQLDALLVSASKVELDKEGGSFNIEVQHNVNFTVRVEAPATNWISMAPTKGLDKRTLSFSAAENDGVEKRHGVITFTSDSVVEQVDVYQSGSDPVIVLGENEYNLSAAGGEIKVDVASNVDVTYEIKASWIHETKTKALSTNTFYFTVDPNASYDDRSAVIVFKNARYGLSESVIIYQAQQDAIIPGESSYDFDYKTQTFEMNVDANVDFSVSFDDGVDWIHLVGTKGLTSHTLTFSLDENNTKATREGAVRLIAGDLCQILTFRQIPTTDHFPATKAEVIESEQMATNIAAEATSIVEAAQSISRGKGRAQAIAEEILKNKDVITAIPDNSGCFVRIMKRDSSFMTLIVNLESEEGDSSPSYNPMPQATWPTAVASTPKNSDDETDGIVVPGGKRAILIAPFYSTEFHWLSIDGMLKLDYEWIGERLAQIGYTLDPPVLDDKAGLRVFNGDFLSQYDLIMIASHGNTYDSGFSDWTSTIVATRQKVGTFTEVSDPDLYPYVESLFQNGDGCYVITPEWMKNTTSSLPAYQNSIVYISSCFSYLHDDLANYFTSSGAAAYLGFTTMTHWGITLGINQPNGVLCSFIRNLTNGMSAGRAVEYQKPDNREDKELWTIPYTSFFTQKNEYGTNAYDIALGGNDAAHLVNPIPGNLTSNVDKLDADLSWTYPRTTGMYDYTLVFMNQKEKVNGINGVVVKNLAPGEYSWYLQADLLEPGTGRVLETYTTRPDSFTVNPIDLVIPEEIREKMEPYIPIYDGTNPPDVTGTYLISPFVAVYCEDGHYEPGHKCVDVTIRFSNQDPVHNTLDYDSYDAYSRDSGPGAFISGTGENFSAFFDTEGQSFGIYTKMALVISGTISSKGIKDLYYAFVMVKKGDDPNHKIMNEGVFRVFKDSDGISVRSNWNPSSASPAGLSPENIDVSKMELVMEGRIDSMRSR